VTTSETTTPGTQPPPTTGAPARDWTAVAAVGVTMVLWASAFVAIRHLGQDFRAGALSLGRCLVAALLLGVLAVSRGLTPVQRRDWWRFAVIGVLWYAVYNLALTEGERHVDAGTAALLLQFSPLILAVLAAVVLHEPFSRELGIGLVVALAGVSAIAFSGDATGANTRPVLGSALCLVAALVYSVSVVVQKPLMTRVPAIQVTWLACTVGAVACLPWAGDLVHDVRSAPASSVWWVVYLGAFPTAIGFTTYAYALSRMSASQLGVTTYLVPVVTIVLAWLLLSEAPAPLAYAGGALTLLGVALAGRRSRAAAPPAG
jgi:drug/metabolite transporter (DMT)-like permease